MKKKKKKKKPIYKTLFYATEGVGDRWLENTLNKMYEDGYQYIGSVRFTLIFMLIAK